MPPINRKRRRNVAEDEDEEEAEHNSQSSSPSASPAPPSRRNRNNAASTSRRAAEAPMDAEEPAATVNDREADDSDEAETQGGDSGAQSQMVKKLVRLALASEYSRTPVRRADITAKVLGARSRQFRAVFDEAQMVLRQTFGMELVELPLRERITLKDRRAAQSGATTGASGAAGSVGNAGAGAGSAKAWILKSSFPEKFRTANILPPPRCPTADLEAAYVGLYSFIVAVVTLSGGVLPEAKMERYLKRVNAETSTPVDKTEKLLQRMIRDGYLVRVKETVSGEEVVEYIVGTRAKMEIGEKGVEGLVKNVYGLTGEDEAQDLQKRIERSLKISGARMQATQSTRGGAPAVEQDGATRRHKGRAGHGARRLRDDDNDEDED